jgi:hypothetical protein
MLGYVMLSPNECGVASDRLLYGRRQAGAFLRSVQCSSARLYPEAVMFSYYCCGQFNAGDGSEIVGMVRIMRMAKLCYARICVAR